LKLLIADDDVTSRAILGAVTRQWGYESMVVEDGEFAWEALQEEDPPRLLLLDWMMPNLDGLNLCRRIREQETSNPPFIIVLTARTDSKDIVAALEAGANDHISKPFDNGELQARLQVGTRMLDMQSELHRIKEELFVQATRDALTGLLNRGAVMEELEQEMSRARRQRERVTVGLCDIDFFKKINDTYGHLAGDAVLRDVAARIEGALRPYDHVGRYGGEEFLIIIPSSDGKVLDPFERVRRAIADKPFVFEGMKLDVTMSCGVAVYAAPQYGQDGNALIGATDTALYEAKEGGRNRTVLAESSRESDDPKVRSLPRNAWP